MGLKFPGLEISQDKPQLGKKEDFRKGCWGRSWESRGVRGKTNPTGTSCRWDQSEGTNGKSTRQSTQDRFSSTSTTTQKPLHHLQTRRIRPPHHTTTTPDPSWQKAEACEPDASCHSEARCQMIENETRFFSQSRTDQLVGRYCTSRHS